MSSASASSAPRFFQSELDVSVGDVLRLSDEEARHAVSALRIQPNDRLELFDGQGRLATARVASVARRQLDVEVLGVEQFERSVVRVTLAVAPPKGDRLRWLVEKLTELGVDRIQLVQTRHAVVEPGEQKLNKLRQTALAACKQSRRVFAPQIAPTIVWNELLASTSADQRMLVAHPGGSPLLTTLSGSESRSLLLAVGPEGGFAREEIDAALSAGAGIVSLGHTILRIETAAIAMAATAQQVRFGQASVRSAEASSARQTDSGEITRVRGTDSLNQDLH